MKFKRLEMVGFKSFVDRTVIEFGDRLTAVVGPNGCGKSNVSDAIRWVLGEQAPRALRAKRMEDVIFNGSADRKPYGMAEVSLTISNIKGVVTSPEYKDFEELIVTRRLYRSGESEYLINRNPARLKDITDLFLDTGVSLDTFSIVEQGRIEGLVNAKPLDRRLLIEEAAGIMKYKSRRNEALRKLELAQGNLLRVADVMREKESRLRSLRRQAKKATFYKEYQQEVEELSLHIAALELLRLEAELSPAEEEYTRLKGQEELLLASISAKEADRERLRIELSERSEKLAETRRHAVEVEGVLQRLDNRLEMLSGQLIELDAEDARRAEEMDALAAEGERIKLESERLAALEDELAVQTEEAQRKFDAGAAQLSAVRAQLAEVEAASSDARKTQAEETETLSRMRQRIAAAESQREGVERAIARLAREVAAAEHLREQAGEETRVQTAHFEETAESDARLRAEAERLSAENERARVLLRSSEEKFSTERESLVSSRSSLQELERLRDEAVGRAGESEFRAAGAEVLGVLVDALTVEPDHRKAIEAALGETLSGVLVRDGEAALRAIQALVQAENRRGLALPLAPRRKPVLEVPVREGVLGAATGLVRCASEYRPLIESLLGTVAVARDLDAARGAMPAGSAELTWVTLSGEVILPSGAVEGGLAGERVSGLLDRASRRTQLQTDVQSTEVRLSHLTSQSQQQLAESQRLEEESRRASQSAREAELAKVEAEEKLRACKEKLHAAEERFQQLSGEHAQQLREQERLVRELQEAHAEGERATASRAEAESRATSAEEARMQVSAKAGEVEAAVTERRVALTELQGRLSGVRGELQRLSDAGTQNEARRVRRMEEKEDSMRKRERIEMNRGQSREEISLRREEKAAIEKEQAVCVALVEETRTQESAITEWIRQMRDEATILQGHISEAAERRTSLRVRRESMIEIAKDNYEVHLPEVAEQNREQLPAYQELVNRLEMLQQRLDRMGEVNPLAAREFDEVNQEYAFLKEQEEDLERSIADLHATIEKLNQTTRHRFVEAFEKVSEQFAKIFSRLFEGGEARMYLLDPNDPLETGVDIEVRPPGKRPGNIMLLSAGEKALTAIALLFSVFSVRPSPFCLLDEVDATLDDANVGRFRNILGELEDRSQFVVVTHNKKTMSYATQLYGITQKEKGVSIVVSVKFDRKEEEQSAGAGGLATEAVEAG